MPNLWNRLEIVFKREHHGHGHQHGPGGHRHERSRSRFQAFLRSRTRPADQPEQPAETDRAKDSAVKPPAAPGEGPPAAKEEPPQ